ncbi:MAG TPA: DUF2085 domain-containing protein [Thermomicrobiales bacterium]|nr:DUF2085 domain-containing protein [Thermomicrobiales bacterium]
MVQHRIDLAKVSSARPTARAYLFPLVAGGLVLLFLLAPWPLHEKAHTLLHGLCAQRPTHSLLLGGMRLPFDARMTGIYGGFAIASAYLLARGRYRAAAMPGKLMLAALMLFVGAMGIDGFNSFLVDAALWHPYTPDNRLRLVTGLLCGITLAVTICFLLASTLWKRPDLRRPAVEGPFDLALIVVIQVPYVALVLSGAGWLYDPVAMLLVLSATAVVSSLVLVAVVLFRQGDNGFTSVRQLQGSATMALLLGIGVMAAFAGGRFLLEHLTGAPPLM